MSRAAELARLEADAVEAEDTDEAEAEADQADAEPDAEQPAEPPAPPPDVDPKALERVVAKYEKDLRRVLGPAAESMHPCPVCEGMGFTPGEVEPPPQLVQDPQLEPCPECNALGLVLTGSKRDGQDMRSCTHCSGNGYRTKPIELPGGNGVGAGGPHAGSPIATAPPEGPADVFGRPWGHRDYGLHPATVNAT